MFTSCRTFDSLSQPSSFEVSHSWRQTAEAFAFQLLIDSLSKFKSGKGHYVNRELKKSNLLMTQSLYISRYCPRMLQLTVRLGCWTIDPFPDSIGRSSELATKFQQNCTCFNFSCADSAAFWSSSSSRKGLLKTGVEIIRICSWQDLNSHKFSHQRTTGTSLSVVGTASIFRNVSIPPTA